MYCNCIFWLILRHERLSSDTNDAAAGGKKKTLEERYFNYSAGLQRRQQRRKSGNNEKTFDEKQFSSRFIPDLSTPIRYNFWYNRGLELWHVWKQNYKMDRKLTI